MRITRQLGTGQSPNIGDVRAEIAKIKKMITQLYERPIIAELVMETVIPPVEVPNIWEDPTAVPVEETRKNKKKKKRKDKAVEKKSRLKSIQDEAD